MRVNCAGETSKETSNETSKERPTLTLQRVGHPEKQKHKSRVGGYFRSAVGMHDSVIDFTVELSLYIFT